MCRHFSPLFLRCEDYSIRSSGTRGASYAILFPRHKRNRFAAYFPLLSTIHTRPTDSRSTNNLAARCVGAIPSSRYPTFFDAHCESMQKTRPSRCHNRWTDAKSAFVFPRLTSQLFFPLDVLTAFFSLARYLRPAINRRDSRCGGTNAFSAICNVMCNT